ncbi:MAG: leucine-rich repeat domain-containing protein, partial [Clostridia bacterium]|nr:leucine-rich repeat domain-containing protein [Clostridia bacterium]
AFKKGYIEDECHLCNPYTHYLDRTVFAVNEATGTVHRFSCGTADRLAAEVTANSIPSGKRNCSSCSPQKIEEHSFAEHMLNSLEYNDWNSSLSSVKNYLNNSPVKDKQTNTKELKEFKFYLGKIVVGVQLNLVFEIYFEGTVDYSYSVSTTNIYGLRLEDGKLKAYNSSDKKDNTSSFDLTGKISTSVCLETYVYLSVTGLEWLVNAGIAIDLGAYADLSGIIHIPYYAEDEKLYTAAYFEAGLFTNLSFKYNIGVWDGKISLIGGKKKLPLIKVGYDKVYYDYYGENNEIDVHGTSVDLDDYDLLKVKYYNAKTNSGGNDMLSLDGKYGLYSVDIALLDTLGNPSSYGTISNGVITLSKDAPCDTTIVARISVEGNSKTITTFKDFFANQYSLGNVKYDLEDIYVTLRFSNHKYSEWQTTIEPTCTEDGLEQSFPLCQCTEIFENVLPALGHEMAKINAVAATCTTDGHTAETYCSRCSEIFIVRKILPAFGHKYSVEYTCIDRPCQNPGCSYVSPASTPHNYSDWAEVPASGCALEAYQLRFCFDCSKIETDPADAYGSDHVHKPENVRYAEYIPPTCTEDGHYVLVCVACNVELLRESVPAIKEHNIGKNVPYVYDDESGHYKICAYDCGYKTEVTAHVFKNACDTSCEHCEYTKDPSAIKHKWEGMKDEDHHWDECSVCGVLKGEKEAHCGGVATCTNDGICSVCGYHYLDKLGHDLGEYVCTETHHYKVCQNDGCSYTAKRGVHKKPENAYPCFGDVKCTVCDYVITPFNGGCVADTEHGLIQDSINSVHYYRCVNGCPSQIDAESCYGGENACYTRNVCEKCGNKYGPYIDHLLEKDDNGYDKYYHDSENHWKICTRENCNVADKRILVGEHQPSHLDPKCTDAVKCKVCDLQLKEKGEHEWCETPVYQATLDKHMYVCGKCSVKRFESCRGGEANCTTPAICDLCGSYYGTALGHSPVGDTYFKNEMFHWQLCLRSNCPSPNGVFNLETHTPDAEANSCVEDVTCTVCGYICEKSKGGHDWDEYEKHDNDFHRRECKVCHTVEYTDCTGGNNVCGERNLCDLCGTEYRDPVAHDLGNGNYSYDAFDHWQVCQRENCPAEDGIVNVEAHIPDPQGNTCVEDVYCIVCGYLCREKVDGHAWSQYENVSDGTHRRRCDLCGATETGDCYGGENVCGSKNICKACNTEYGAVIEHDTGDGEYSFSESSHWLICRRESCPYADGIIDFAPHVPDPDTNSCVDDVKCTVCGYVTTPSRGGHTPSDTCIGTDSESTHKTECEYCSELLTEDCYGGENICGKKNICEGCGHEYGEVVEHLANEYCNDDSYHWAICIRPACPLADGIFGKEEHVYDDSLPVCEIDKICTVCGYFSESAPGHSPAEIPVCGTGSNSAYHFYVCTNEGCDYLGQREEHVFDRAVEAPEYLCANASCSHGAIYYYSCICGKSAGDNNSLVDTDDRFTVGVGLDHSYIYSPDSNGTHHWTYKCSMCGDILDKEEHYGGENTCTEKAVCEFCGEKYGTTLPHSYIYAIEDEKYAVRETVGGEVVIKTVSCERDGEYWYSCICGKSGGSEKDESLRPGTFTVEAYGHDPSGEIIPVYFNGKGCHYQRCLICDDVDWSVEDHFGGSNVCGQKNACDACGVLYGEKIEHLPDIEGYHVEADRHYKVCLRANCSYDNNLYEVGVHRYNAAPYCTKDRVCTVCGYLAEYAQGHSLELTGDEEGHRYVCVAPGCDYEEEVLPHNYGEPVFSPDLDEHICRYSYTCSDCGYVHYEEVDHRYPETEITLVKEDIYVEEEGVTVYLIRICKECLSCGHLLEIGQSSDHAHSDIRLSDHVYPGCTVPGHTAGAFCAVEGCGFVYVEEESIDPLGHDYVNGICRRCGEAEPTEGSYSQGLEFTLSSDGSYYIVSGIGTCTDLDVRIPPTYEGKPVKEISNFAFRGCSSLTRIDIPDEITRIGFATFENCSTLTIVNISNASMLNSIGGYAFYGCSSLESINIPDGITYISEHTFSGCSSIKHVNIPDNVTSIGDRAFSDCSSLTSIDIPDRVTYIGISAFWSCSSLTSIDIPDEVTYIGNFAFFGCSKITSINIPEQVIFIGYNAFYKCSNLSLVTFDNPDGWWIATDSSAESGTSISASDLADPAKAAEYMKSTYCDYYWNHTEMTEDDSNYSQGLEFTLSSDGSYYIVTGIGTCTDLDVKIP